MKTLGWKMSAVNLCMFLIITLPILAQQSPSTESPYQISLTLTKNSFLVGEDIPIGIGVVNITEKTMPGVFTQTIQLFLYDSVGNAIGSSLPANASPRIDSLAPREEAFNLILVNDYFGKIYGVAAYYRYLDPGKYTLKAILHHPLMADPESIQVSFQVIAPTGNELLVRKAFIELVNGVQSGKYNGAEHADNLWNLYQTNQSSVYCPFLLTDLCGWYAFVLKEPGKALATCKELVDKYPPEARIPAE